MANNQGPEVVIGKGSTKFTFDGQDVLMDDDIVSGITKYQNGPGIDNKLLSTNGSTSSYFLADHLGSTNGLTSASGALTASNGYDSFGNPTNSSFPTRYQFTGREFDSTINLQFSRARFYDPKLGRFISEDPIGLSGGINQYAYVRNNSVNKTDPLGLYERDVHYYLTFYLASRNGCFTRFGAMQIAAGNQWTDDDPTTAPGPKRVGINSTYHALNAGASPGVGSPDLYAAATRPSPNNFMFGRYLHEYQDRFSHSGFTDPVWGHSPYNGGDHSVDKTADDIWKTLKMAQSTYAELSSYSSLACQCKGNPWTLEMTRTVLGFARIGTSFPRFADIDGDSGIPRVGKSWMFASPEAMNAKIKYLGF